MAKAKEPEYFIGSSKVKEFKITDGVDLVGVLFDNGKTQDLTVEQWEALKDTDSYPDGEVSIRKFEKLIVRLLKQMTKSRVTVGEQAWILETVSRTIGQNYEGAIAKLFTQTLTENVMLAQIDEVLKSKD